VSISPGVGLQLWDCAPAQANQQWDYDGTALRVYGDKCLDAVDNGTANGTEIQLWYCNGGGAQRWDWLADGMIYAVYSTPAAVGDPGDCDYCVHCTGIIKRKIASPLPALFAAIASYGTMATRVSRSRSAPRLQVSDRPPRSAWTAPSAKRPDR
jgi:hypothetical protein